jgi:hypothetical protein
MKIKLLKTKQVFFKVILFNKAVSRLFKNKNNLFMNNLKLKMIIQAKAKQVCLAVLCNSKFKHLKVDFHQDYNLKMLQHNHNLSSVNSIKIQLFNLEISQEVQYSITNKQFLETHQ